MKIRFAVLLALCAAAASARADAVDTLREFVRDVKSGSAQFTQTVTSPDGAKKKTSSGNFLFSRPNRFRFAYTKPFEQVIVADGQKVWIYDADLNQVSSRKLSAAIGATPAALPAGGSPRRTSNSPLPAAEGLEWAAAKPKAKDGAFDSLKVGFRGKELAAVEIVDSFGQRSLLQFSQFKPNAPTSADAFRFVAPKGADVIEQ
ncbi:outer membrane lipoprotein chaperone LolA [Piscinibacter aquaticus]|uniref:Outer-membrane lipoprotein carrier protein n=1 Tax=Piscinibacter aquaticus TaxID=392597 RepID=A0A5C6TYC1_9BURK|nr:outer membrane lipoprotein chaperone LolA [Piscinibacter aquaticus]